MLEEGTRQMVDPPGKPEGWARLCYWCRDHVPFEKANHIVKDCPFFQQEKLDFWTSQGINLPFMKLNKLLQKLRISRLRKTGKESCWGWVWDS